MRRFTPTLLFAATLIAASSANAEGLSISAAIGFVSGYICRGVQFAEEASFDPSRMIGYVIDDAIDADYLYGAASVGLSTAF